MCASFSWQGSAFVEAVAVGLFSAATRSVIIAISVLY